MSCTPYHYNEMSRYRMCTNADFQMRGGTAENKPNHLYHAVVFADSPENRIRIQGWKKKH